MLPVLSGAAALLFSIFTAVQLANAGAYTLAVASIIGGLSAFALLKTLGDILDALTSRDK